MSWPLLIPVFTWKADCFLQKECSQNERVPFSQAKPFISSWCNCIKSMVNNTVNIYIIIILPLITRIYWYNIFTPIQMNAGLLSVFGLQMCPYGHMPVSYFLITLFPNLENLESSSIINIPLSNFFSIKKNVLVTPSCQMNKHIQVQNARFLNLHSYGREICVASWWSSGCVQSSGKDKSSKGFCYVGNMGIIYIKVNRIFMGLSQIHLK